ncbi:MAG: hypothetical protein AAF658_19570 [Myxococcota bacterium]
MTQTETLESFLGRDNDAWRQDPQLEFLKTDILKGGFEILRVSFPQKNLELPNNPRIYVITGRDGVMPQQHAMDWTPPLEAFLFKHHVKATNRDQEANRGAHLLLHNLRWAEKAWGTGGYVPLVFHRLVSESLGNVEPITKLLERRRTDNVDTSSPSFAECVAYLSDAVFGYGNSLRAELGYDERDAAGIFLFAVARTVDKYFHITDRMKLFGR